MFFRRKGVIGLVGQNPGHGLGHFAHGQRHSTLKISFVGEPPVLLYMGSGGFLGAAHPGVWPLLHLLHSCSCGGGRAGGGGVVAGGGGKAEAQRRAGHHNSLGEEAGHPLWLAGLANTFQLSLCQTLSGLL